MLISLAATGAWNGSPLNRMLTVDSVHLLLIEIAEIKLLN
jgi:hypothetical protein